MQATSAGKGNKLSPQDRVAAAVSRNQGSIGVTYDRAFENLKKAKEHENARSRSAVYYYIEACCLLLKAGMSESDEKSKKMVHDHVTEFAYKALQLLSIDGIVPPPSHSGAQAHSPVQHQLQEAASYFSIGVGCEEVLVGHDDLKKIEGADKFPQTRQFREIAAHFYKQSVFSYLSALRNYGELADEGLKKQLAPSVGAIKGRSGLCLNFVISGLLLHAKFMVILHNNHHAFRIHRTLDRTARLKRMIVYESSYGPTSAVRESEQGPMSALKLHGPATDRSAVGASSHSASRGAASGDNDSAQSIGAVGEDGIRDGRSNYGLISAVSEVSAIEVLNPEGGASNADDSAIVEKLQRIVKELVESEERYFECLTVMLDLFVGPLEYLGVCEGADDQSLRLGAEQKQKLFGNIETIHHLHKRLLDDFRRAIPPNFQVQSIERPAPESSSASLPAPSNTSALSSPFLSIGSLSKVFLDIGPYFKLYSAYATNFEASRTTLCELWEQNAEFRSFIQSTEADPRCKGQNLQSLLIMPVQRVPRYTLLLADLLKTLPNDHPDWNGLEQAFKLVTDMATHVNERVRIDENRRKIWSLQDSLAQKANLLAPGRLLVKEGPLTRKTRSGEQTCTFYLFSDLLIYTSFNPITQQQTLRRMLPIDQSFSVSSVQYMERDHAGSFSGIPASFSAFSLASLKLSPRSTSSSPPPYPCSLSPPPEVPPPASSLEVPGLRINSSVKSFLAYARSKEERDSWVETINACIEDNMLRREAVLLAGKSFGDTDAKGRGGKTGAADVVKPVLASSATEAHCALCAANFSLFHRKHHCRECGRLVCASCSTGRRVLVGAGGEQAEDGNPQRVCDECVRINPSHQASRRVNAPQAGISFTAPSVGSPAGISRMGGVSVDTHSNSVKNVYRSRGWFGR